MNQIHHRITITVFADRPAASLLRDEVQSALESSDIPKELYWISALQPVTDEQLTEQLP